MGNHNQDDEKTKKRKHSPKKKAIFPIFFAAMQQVHRKHRQRSRSKQVHPKIGNAPYRYYTQVPDIGYINKRGKKMQEKNAEKGYKETLVPSIYAGHDSGKPNA
ncbi:MAG: hypothetical protein IJU50_08010 [Lachnospiraceae bacterium]|nr:hypothetical protein [Lachnospiraceae bacterium]